MLVDGGAATVMVVLGGLVLLAVSERDGELEQAVESTARAAGLLHRLLTHCADAAVPELARLARTLDTWRPELLAAFDHPGVSNGPTEAVNLMIKKIKRVGHGFRNLANYRLRLLLHCGVTWNTTTRHLSEPEHHAWLRRAGYRRESTPSAVATRR